MKKGCLYSVIGAIVLASVFLGFYLYQKNKKAKDEITSYSPKYERIINKTVSSGSIVPKKEVLIKPQISGIIEELMVKAGDMVKTGDAIAKIQMVPSPTNLNSAKSAVDLARISLNESKRRLKNQKNLLDKRLDIENAASEFELAKTEELRSKTLLSEGIISDQEYQQALNRFKVAKTTYENAKISSVNNVDQLQAEVSMRQEELNQAINNLQLLESGVARKSGQVSNIIRSTIDGMILEVPVEEGFSVVERNNFNDGTTVATVADMSELIYEGNVDESDVGLLHVGLPIKIKIGALAEQDFDGSLNYIAPKGQELDGAIKFEVKATFKYPKDVFIRSGYSASGDIILEELDHALVVKERDLIFEDTITFVEILESDGDIKKIKIETGISNGIDIQILEGLDTTSLVKAQEKVEEEEEND